MNRNDRNPWEGLTTAQLADLEAALREPHRAIADPLTAYADIASAYAIRTAVLLVGNDLRGAMHFAEISVAAAALGQRRAETIGRARERINAIQAAEALDPRGPLTYVPGKRRRVRVKASAAPAVPRSLGGQSERLPDLGPVES